MPLAQVPPLSPLQQKLGIVSVFLRARLRRFRNRTALESFQERKTQHLLRQILPFSPHTASRLPDNDVTRWREMPIIDKAQMMRHFDTLNTAGIHLNDALDLAMQAESNRHFSPTLRGYTIGLSSGTSGSRGVFVVSPQERILWAGEQLAHWLPRVPWRQERIAFFLRANSQLYTTLGSKHIHFNFFDLATPLEHHLASLNAFKPSFLTGPPSVLAWLARQQNKGLLRIRPHTVISSAEVLDAVDAAHISESFGVQVHQVYQATEGLLGLSCPHGLIHLAEFGVHFEPLWLDRTAGLFSPIVTDFSRKTQPIIRYRMNDILQMSPEPCPCGSPYTAIQTIHGRCDDIFILPHCSGTREVRIFPDYVRRTITTASPHIIRYRIILNTEGGVVVELDTTPGHERETRAAVEHHLKALFTRYHAQVPTLEFLEFQTPLGLNKLKRVESRRNRG